MQVGVTAEARPAPAPIMDVAAALPIAPAAGPEMALQEDQYLDVDVLDAQLRQRESERFYLLPDGGGGRQVVTAGVLAGTAKAEPVAGAEVPTAVWRSCAAAPAIPHLLAVTDTATQQSLVFPVIDPRAPSVRYGGYSLPLPDRATQARVQAIVRDGMSADIAVVLVNAAGSAVAAVNNIATESIPETLFRYAMVAGNVPLAGHAESGYRLVVMEAPWARKLLPAGCQPAVGNKVAVAGRVSVEFMQEGSKKP